MREKHLRHSPHNYMTREIKFRAWDKKKIIDWESFIKYDYYGESDYDLHAIFSGDEHMEIMQYTGLKDKNGKEIYEGDIDGDSMGYINFCNKCIGYQFFFKIDGQENCHCCEGDFDIREGNPIEIIGNIYSNPELLETK